LEKLQHRLKLLKTIKKWQKAVFSPHSGGMKAKARGFEDHPASSGARPFLFEFSSSHRSAASVRAKKLSVKLSPSFHAVKPVAHPRA
jgi:hypothetical protein